eukprot:8959632-Pyramimonas_sp.AAC.1
MVCSCPANHLMQQVQMIDEKGNGLELLLSPKTNFFMECGRVYSRLIDCDGEDAPLRTLIPQSFSYLGPEALALIMHYCLVLCLGIASRVWRHLTTRFSDWRYRL